LSYRGLFTFFALTHYPCASPLHKAPPFCICGPAGIAAYTKHHIFVISSRLSRGMSQKFTKVRQKTPLDIHAAFMYHVPISRAEHPALCESTLSTLIIAVFLPICQYAR